MERQFTLVTDGQSDLPANFITEYDVKMIPAPYSLDGVDYSGAEGDVHESKEFYKIMRSGSMPTTSQINALVIKDKLIEFLKEGKEILLIGFSSALSGTLFQEKTVVDELNENPDNPRIYLIDSKMATVGETLMVWYAMKQRDEGKTAKEVYDWCIKHGDQFCGYFTPDDLNHLHRGGRVSKASAVLGSMLGIKPVLHINIEGKLIPIAKVRGRKAALDALVDNLIKKSKGINNEMITIGHADCYDDAVYVKDQIQEKTGHKDFIIDFIGPVIGTHAGPGTVALFFLGDTRVVE